MDINFYLNDRFNDTNGVILQIVKNVDKANTIMFHARLRYVLTKEAHELQRFFVVKDEMRSERLNLLLFCSAVYQRRIVAIGNAEGKKKVLFVWDQRKICFLTQLVPMMNRILYKFLPTVLFQYQPRLVDSSDVRSDRRNIVEPDGYASNDL